MEKSDWPTGDPTGTTLREALPFALLAAGILLAAVLFEVFGR